MKRPTYRLEDFILVCGQSPSKVVPIEDTLEDARVIFKLNTKSELLNFISDGGLESIEFVNTKIWEKNPNPAIPIYVDAYHFTTCYMLGYLAFLKNDKTGFWMIKSFHLSKERNTEMQIKIQNFLDKMKGNTNE